MNHIFNIDTVYGVGGPDSQDVEELKFSISHSNVRVYIQLGTDMIVILTYDSRLYWAGDDYMSVFTDKGVASTWQEIDCPATGMDLSFVDGEIVLSLTDGQKLYFSRHQPSGGSLRPLFLRPEKPPIAATFLH